LRRMALFLLDSRVIRGRIAGVPPYKVDQESAYGIHL
jgi:hypothetical protein